MGIWEILGIEPTDNPAHIKKAYAKKLKIHNPEDDPEGFQRLREAYDTALKFTRNTKRNRLREDEPAPIKRQPPQLYELEDTEPEDLQPPRQRYELTNTDIEEEEQLKPPRQRYDLAYMDEDEDEERNFLTPPRRRYELAYADPEEDLPNFNPPKRITLFDRFLEDSSPEIHEDSLHEETPIPQRYHFTESDNDLMRPMEPEEIVEHFFQRVHMLYNNYHERIKPENWRELLNDEAMWNVGCHQLIDARFLYFLEEHPHLPLEIWKLLDSHFTWHKKMEQLADQLSDRFLLYLQGQLNESYTLRYHHFEHRTDLDIESFLEFRSDAFLALLENDWETAQTSLANAHAIYAQDPDLIRLEGEYFLRTGNPHRALHAFDQLIALDPENIDAYLQRARCHLEKGSITDAIRDCQEILKRLPNHWDAKSLLGKALLRLGEWEKAQDLFQEILQHNPSDLDAKICLTQIQSPFEKKAASAANNHPHPARKKNLQALGLPSKLASVEQFFRIYTRRNFWSLLFLLLLHYAMFVVVSMKLDMSAEQMMNTVAYKYKPLQIQSIEELQQTQPGYEVEFHLTKASYLNLLRVYDKEKHPEPKAEFLPAPQSEERNLLNSDTGYVNVGYLGEKAIIVITDFPHAKEIHDNKSITMRGTLKEMPEGEMLPVIINTLNNRKHPYNAALVTNLYINAKPDLEDKGWTGSWLLGILAFISMLYYIRMIREIPKTRKVVTFH